MPLLADVVSELDAGLSELKLGERLASTTGLSVTRRTALLQVAQARRKARSRYLNAEHMVFTRNSLEQFSDPHVAKWRADSLVQRFTADTNEMPDRLVDLTAGVGGDALFLGEHDAPLTCVEIDPARAVFLRHNLDVRGIAATIVVGDALTFPTRPNDAVFSDPARRVDGRRVKALAAYRPPVPLLVKRHSGARICAVAIAPGIDASDPALPPNNAVSYIDVAGQLTEAVLWVGQSQASTSATREAVLLPENVTRVCSDTAPDCAVDKQIGGWLITMRPAAIRARVHDDIARTINARRVAHHRALFHTPTKPDDSPWYDARPIMSVGSAAPKQLRAMLRELPAKPIELVLHGLQADVTRLWQQLGAPERGPQGWRVELVRRDSDTVAVITDTKT